MGHRQYLNLKWIWMDGWRCVSFIFTGLFQRWARAKISEAILAELLSGCDPATCLTKCKASHSKVCEMLKSSAIFKQTECFVLFAKVLAIMLSATPDPCAPVVHFWSWSHLFQKWLAACLAPSHYHNQCWFVVDCWGRQWNLGNDITSFENIAIWHGPLTRYAKLWVAHALGMPGTFSQPLTSKETTS